jgi:hypothetical protein
MARHSRPEARFIASPSPRRRRREPAPDLELATALAELRAASRFSSC